MAFQELRTGIASIGKKTIRLSVFCHKWNYIYWVDRMIEEDLKIGPVLDIICDQMNLSAVDRKWRHRKGWAKKHLLSALDLYKDDK